MLRIKEYQVMGVLRVQEYQVMGVLRVQEYQVIGVLRVQREYQVMGVLRVQVMVPCPNRTVIHHNTRHFNPPTECTREHLLKIALLDFDWRRVGRRLLQSEQYITDIHRDQPDEPNRREKMLMIWQSQKGSSATYRVLASTFQTLQYGAIAEKVKEMEGKK